MSPNDALKQLRDIHLPPVQAEEISMPLWILPLIAMIIASLGCVWWRNKRRKHWVVQARTELLAIEHDALHAQAKRGWQRLAVLMRQLVLLRWPQASVAATTGNEWLHLLDHTFGTTLFSIGDGRSLADNPYRKQLRLDDQQLADLCQALLPALDKLALQPITLSNKLPPSNSTSTSDQTS